MTVHNSIMDHSPEASHDGGICDIAIDEKKIDDITMDMSGDHGNIAVDENDLMKGNKDESDIGIGIGESGDFTSGTELEQFSALDRQENGLNMNGQDDMDVDKENEDSNANSSETNDDVMAENQGECDKAPENKENEEITTGDIQDESEGVLAEDGEMAVDSHDADNEVLDHFADDHVLEQNNDEDAVSGHVENDDIDNIAKRGSSGEAADTLDNVGNDTDNVLDIPISGETTDHDETATSFVTAADESFTTSTSELLEKTTEMAEDSQEDLQDRLLDEPEMPAIELQPHSESSQGSGDVDQEEIAEDVTMDFEGDTVGEAGRDGIHADSLEDSVISAHEAVRDDENLQENEPAERDISQDKGESDSVDDFIENLVTASDTKETTERDEGSSEQMADKEEPFFSEEIETVGEAHNIFNAITDTQDSVDEVISPPDHTQDQVSSPKGFVKDSVNTQNSLSETVQNIEDDNQPIKDASEMAQMQAFYGDCSKSTNNTMESDELSLIRNDSISQDKSANKTDKVRTDSDSLTNNENNALSKDSAIDENRIGENETDSVGGEMETEIDNFEKHKSADSTSESVSNENEDNVGRAKDDSEHLVGNTEQKKNEDFGEEQTEKQEEKSEGNDIIADELSEPKAPEIDADLLGAKDIEEVGSDKELQSKTDTDQEMTEADETQLLKETEEEQKADEEEEAMETDEKSDEKEASSEQSKTSDEEVKAKDTSTEQTADNAGEVAKTAEAGENNTDDMDVSTEAAEKTAKEVEESTEGMDVDAEMSAETPKDTEKTAEDTDNSAVGAEKTSKDKEKISDAMDVITETEKTVSEAQEQIAKSAQEPVQSEEKKVEADKIGDFLDKEVKQEKLDEHEIKQDDSSLGPKIIGVTSAVGMEELKPVPSAEKKSSAGEKKKSSREVSPVVIDDEEDKKEPKPEVKSARKTRSSSAAAIKKEQDEKKPIKQEGEDKDDDVIAIKEEKKPVTQKPKSSSKIQKCIVCLKVGKCKYNIVRNGDVKHLCDDVCFKKFRSNPTEYLRQATPTAAGSQGKTETKAPPSAPAANQNQQKQAQSAPPPVFKTCSVCQLMNVRTSKPFLSWQGLDFCGEECLGKFQGGLSATCSYCASQINQGSRAKFCWRVDTEVKQFCSSPCYNEFIKRLKLCAFCNKDLANIRDSFMAPVGNQGTFKDFCSQLCLAKYEERNNKDIQIVGVERGQKTSMPPKGNFQCHVCGKTGPVKHEIKLDGKQNRLCSDPCLSAFQYANKLTMNTCDNCGTNCYNENTSPQYIQFEGQQKRFCSYMCVNAFKNFNKKTVPCAWCGAKKSNFDMIERVDANNKYQLFCSLNCLSLYRVNLQATSNQAVSCDQCRKFVPAQYHLTMSDASVRNFCSYTCVMQFQAQFTTPKQTQQPTSQPQTQTTQQKQQAGLQTRSKAIYNTRGTNQQPPPQQQKPPPTVTPPQPPKQTARQLAVAQKKLANAGGQSIPIISNVVSLAPQGNQQQINVKSSTPVVVQGQQEGIKTTTTTTGNQTVQQQIIIQPPPPKTVKNKSLLCKPYIQTKATSCKPHTQTKEVQTTGKMEADRYFIPVPIPVYVPTPLAMYTTPTPVMVPVPVPVPVPVFIPTTKKSSGSILKHIKEIQERIPNDPLEAELLIMAEAVAGKDEESSSESEEEPTEALPVVTKEPAAPVAPTAQELGEDMLQMALRMASEMSDEPVMDLENSLEPVAVSSVPPPPAAAPATPVMEEEDDDTDEYIPPSSRNTRRTQGRKRTPTTRKGRAAKRQKVETPQETMQVESTPSPQPAAPPPDANFHLKYTYGVNAWKHWVIAKNSQLENASKAGSSKKLKLFKTDLLQCTADELNYALCLFVKEVRKPNGEEYAVDSIYYLCLGIQQYLFESGRIDNIFTDMYFDKFTDFLNEVLTMYEPKLNTAGQLVCRIEEEHLWESKQLGAHSPHVLLNSLVYFNTKYFMLKTSEDHLKLSFTHIMKHWKKTASGKGSGTGANLGRSVYLRYYCPNLQGKSDPNQKKRKEEMPVYEQTENLENPLRCPVKLYEFYLSKCPESIKNRNDTFYLVPERSCVPDSPVWYSTMTLGIDQMAKMLNRIRLVREIQEAHLHTQPVYI